MTNSINVVGNGGDVPEICVVTPTHNRSRLVARLLESLDQARQACSSKVEIIVIDSSEGNEALEIKKTCKSYDAIYCVGPLNVREKRNYGINRARAPIILFVDSDCEATPTLFSEHLNAYKGHEIGGVLGVTEFYGDDSWMWRVIERTQLLNTFSYARKMSDAPWGTCSNLSYRKSVLEEVGLFDTNFPFRLGGDDVDLGLRVNEAGYRIKCNPEAVVRHTRSTWASLSKVGKRSFRWGRMHYHLFLKYPHRTYYDLPRFTVIALIMGIISVVASLVYSSPGPLFLFLIWVLVAWCWQLILPILWFKRPIREFGYHLIADLISYFFEIGAVFESILKRDLTFLYQEVSYTPPSSTGKGKRIVQIWSMFLALFFVCVVALGVNL